MKKDDEERRIRGRRNEMELQDLLLFGYSESWQMKPVEGMEKEENGKGREGEEQKKEMENFLLEIRS